ncbi:MAG: histidine kinase, partial [Leptolyngbyaceae bacterium]|nr:histidine kinase [Leptolyngbyaceae bacterium]
MLALSRLGIPQSTSVPIFDEATQTAAHFLNTSICILSFTDQDRQYFKSAVGLSRIGLMNDLAVSRQLPRDRS